MRKAIGATVGFIVGILIYAIIYQITIELAGGYDSENFHNLMKSVPIIKPALWVISFFISSIIAGYIARDRGKVVGLLAALPIIILSLIALVQIIVEKDINTTPGGYPLVFIFIIGVIVFPYLGGGLGEAFATRALREK